MEKSRNAQTPLDCVRWQLNRDKQTVHSYSRLELLRGSRHKTTEALPSIGRRNIKPALRILAHEPLLLFLGCHYRLHSLVPVRPFLFIRIVLDFLVQAVCELNVFAIVPIMLYCLDLLCSRFARQRQRLSHGSARRRSALIQLRWTCVPISFCEQIGFETLEYATRHVWPLEVSLDTLQEHAKTLSPISDHHTFQTNATQ
jgi:hypothetical protein